MRHGTVFFQSFKRARPLTLIRPSYCVQSRHAENFSSGTSARLQSGMRFLRHFGEKDSEAPDYRRAVPDVESPCQYPPGRPDIHRMRGTDELGQRRRFACRHRRIGQVGLRHYEREPSGDAPDIVRGRDEKGRGFLFQFRCESSQSRNKERTFSGIGSVACRVFETRTQPPCQLRRYPVQPIRDSRGRTVPSRTVPPRFGYFPTNRPVWPRDSRESPRNPRFDRRGRFA